MPFDTFVGQSADCCVGMEHRQTRGTPAEGGVLIFFIDWGAGMSWARV